jgi:hypothetical protein
MKERVDPAALARIRSDIARADLGDPRRTRRAVQIVERLAQSPGESLPKTFAGDAELEGAYRFVNNAHVTFGDLLAAYAEGTAERARGVGRVLAIHDTTPCQFNHADPDEVGYLSSGKAGFYFHYTLVLDAHGWRRPLGIVHGEVISRKARRRRTGKRKLSAAQMAKWQDKESARWGRGVEATAAALAGVEVVHVADRESDQYALIAGMVMNGDRFVFRLTHDRRASTFDGVPSSVRELARHAEGIVEREVPLSSRAAKTTPRDNKIHPPRASRVAKLRFAATQVDLQRPRHLKDVPEWTPLNVVVVTEIDPPPGEPAVEWLLYTTEAVETPEQVEAVVDVYRARWTIEELNKALKTGCVVQERQFESYEALLNILALTLPIACELLAIRALARSSPDRPAIDALTPGQLEALRHLSRRPLPSAPTVKDALWAIAGVGGHLKRNGEPGWQVLQRGMETFLQFAAGWCAAKADL